MIEINLPTQADNVEQDLWYRAFTRNVASQYGEDGIIEQILSILSNGNKWCVEFGAHDGKYCSNTFNLINNKGYSAVLIEPNPDFFRDLTTRYRSNPQVYCINAFVGFESKNALHTILARTDVPLDFDVLSVDIDGNDYHCWDALRLYRPKIVVIEYNPTIPNTVEFVQKPDLKVSQGSSIASIDKLAGSKGYELVATTRANAIFVDSIYLKLLDIKNNSVQTMRADESAVTYLFSGFDGTVFITGCGKLLWHDILYSQARLQQLPKWLRKYPGNFGIFRKTLMWLFRQLRAKNLI
jgi:hypothetical protein